MMTPKKLNKGKCNKPGGTVVDMAPVVVVDGSPVVVNSHISSE